MYQIRKEKSAQLQSIGRFIKTIKNQNSLGPISETVMAILGQLSEVDPILSFKLLKHFPSSDQKKCELSKIGAELLNKDRLNDYQKVWNVANECSIFLVQSACIDEKEPLQHDQFFLADNEEKKTEEFSKLIECIGSPKKHEDYMKIFQSLRDRHADPLYLENSEVQQMDIWDLLKKVSSELLYRRHREDAGGLVQTLRNDSNNRELLLTILETLPRTRMEDGSFKFCQKHEEHLEKDDDFDFNFNSDSDDEDEKDLVQMKNLSKIRDEKKDKEKEKEK